MTFHHRHHYFCHDIPSFLRVNWVENTLLDLHCKVKSRKMTEVTENHDNSGGEARITFTNVLSHKY